MSSHLTLWFSPDQIEQLEAKMTRLESKLCRLERRHRQTELAIAETRAQMIGLEVIIRAGEVQLLSGEEPKYK